jgi:hypothetical protein
VTLVFWSPIKDEYKSEITLQEDDWMDSSSKAIKQKREENIQSMLWLMVNEVSMMTMSIMTLISQVAGRVCNGRQFKFDFAGQFSSIAI